MTTDTLPQVRVLPVVEVAPTDVKAYWILFGFYPGSRDAYRSVKGYRYAAYSDTPPVVAETILEEAGTRLDGCTELALVFGAHWSDMVDQFRAARGRPRRAKRAA